MTADFLGIDPAAVTRRQMTDDTVSELLNVACGATLGAWMPSADIHFSVPRILPEAELAGDFDHCFAEREMDPDWGWVRFLD